MVRSTRGAAGSDRHVLLDLDGTLIDPKPGLIGSVQFALERLGAPVPPTDDLTWCIGPPLRVTFARLLGEAGPVEEAVRLYRENYRNGAMYEANVYDGIGGMLTELGAAGFRLVIVTSKPHAFARPIAEHFGLLTHVAALYGPGLDGTHDNKAELLATALTAERIGPRSAVMVGDRKFDALAARDNGVPAIGVLWGYGDAAELSEAGAGALAHHPSEVARLVATLIA